MASESSSRSCETEFLPFEDVRSETLDIGDFVIHHAEFGLGVSVPLEPLDLVMAFGFVGVETVPVEANIVSNS